MAHLFRFLGHRDAAGQWMLREDDAHHVVKVLRFATGTQFEIADGCGRWALATIVSLKKTMPEFEVMEEFSIAESPRTLVVFLAALDHGEIDEVIQPLSELGVCELVVYTPLGCDKKKIGEKQLRRWERLAESSMKQCKRSYVMRVRLEPQLREECLLGVDVLLDATLGSEAREWKSLNSGSWGARVGLHVANESGQSDASVLKRHPNYCPVRLGGLVLRAKTAVVAACSLIGADWLYSTED